MKYVIPTRDWVEFLKARLLDIINDNQIPKEELRYSDSVCTHVVRHLLIIRLREMMFWFDDELELRLCDPTDLLMTMAVEEEEGLVARIFPNFASVVGETRNVNTTLEAWGDLLEAEVLDPLDRFIMDHLTTTLSMEPTWDHCTLKQIGNSFILTRGDDYRALFWNKYRNTVKP